jgi:hypothetical protein
MRHKIGRAATAVAALGIVAATLGAGTAQAGTGNTGEAFYRNGHEVAYVIFESRDSGGPEVVEVADRMADNHYVWVEVWDATAGGRKAICSTSGVSWKTCSVNLPEGHKVRLNVYRLNSTDSDFLGELHTSTGALPVA